MLQEDYVKQLITLKVQTYIGMRHGNETILNLSSI